MPKSFVDTLVWGTCIMNMIGLLFNYLFYYLLYWDKTPILPTIPIKQKDVHPPDEARVSNGRGDAVRRAVRETMIDVWNYRSAWHIVMVWVQLAHKIYTYTTRQIAPRLDPITYPPRPTIFLFVDTIDFVAIVLSLMFLLWAIPSVELRAYATAVRRGDVLTRGQISYGDRKASRGWLARTIYGYWDNEFWKYLKARSTLNAAFVLNEIFEIKLDNDAFPVVCENCKYLSSQKSNAARAIAVADTQLASLESRIVLNRWTWWVMKKAYPAWSRQQELQLCTLMAAIERIARAIENLKECTAEGGHPILHGEIRN